MNAAKQLKDNSAKIKSYPLLRLERHNIRYMAVVVCTKRERERERERTLYRKNELLIHTPIIKNNIVVVITHTFRISQRLETHYFNLNKYCLHLISNE